MLPDRITLLLVALVAVLPACGSVVEVDDAVDGDVAEIGSDADADADGDADADADAPPDVPVDVPTDGPTETTEGGSGCGLALGIDCPEEEVCDLRSCDEGSEGTCVPRPVSCPILEDPVCGCDGTTYTNDCERLRAGAALDYPGACSTGSPCGGPADPPCDSREVCDVHSCEAGASGACVPQAGPCTAIYAPVCGCDGTTYTNDCERLVAGAALDHPGPCAVEPVCAPECVRTTDGDWAWRDRCSEVSICIVSVDCTACEVECRGEGTADEGWYATTCPAAGSSGCGAGGLVAAGECSS